MLGATPPLDFCPGPSQRQRNRRRSREVSCIAPVRRRRPTILPLLVALASAQTPQWTVSVDPLTTALGFVHLQTELALGRRFSIYAGPNIKLFDFPGTEQQQYRGYGVEVGLRWFFTAGDKPTHRSAPRGAWVMVRGVAANVRRTDRTEISEFGGYISALAGHTWMFDEVFVVGLGLGIQRIDYTVDGLGIQGTLPAAHSTVGVAF